MDNPQDPLSDPPIPPRVDVRDGTLPQAQVQSALGLFPAGVHNLLGPGESGQEGPLQFATACHKLKLYDARVTQVKQLPLWRRLPPKVASPKLPSKRLVVKNWVIPQIHTRLRRGRFRPVQVQLHPIAPFQLPATHTQIERVAEMAWQIPVYPLEIFSAKAQAYYPWYSRDRLDLDLEAPNFIGLCCHLPPHDGEILRCVSHQTDGIHLVFKPQGKARPDLEGRHGLIFSQADRWQIVRLPPPST